MVDYLLLCWRDDLECRRLVADMTLQLTEDGAGDVTTLDGILVHIAVDGGRRSAEEAVEQHIHHGAVGSFAQIILTIGRAQIVGSLHNLLQVGKGSLVRLGDGGEFIGKHEECSGCAIFHYRCIGTLHQHSDTYARRKVYNICLRFRRQLSILFSLSSLHFIILLLRSSLLAIPVDEFLHDNLLHVSGK